MIMFGGDVDGSDVRADRDDVTGRDFMSFELFEGRLRYIFDVGSGVRVIEDSTGVRLNDNSWHQVTFCCRRPVMSSNK